MYPLVNVILKIVSTITAQTGHKQYIGKSINVNKLHIHTQSILKVEDN